MYKLMFYVPPTLIGGAETQLRQLCKYLPKDKYKVQVVAGSGSMFDFLMSRDWPSHVERVWREGDQLAAEIQTSAPDIIQHYHSTQISSALDKIGFRPKTIEVVHGRKHFPNDVTTTPKKYTSAVVAVSDDARSFYTGATGEPAIVIPNGVDLKMFYPSVTPRKPGPLRILHVGRLCEGDKKLKSIIDACVRLPSNDWVLQLVGNGSDRQEIFDYATDNAPGKIEFWGHREETTDVYRQADIFVSRSESEGFGLTILEAAACGLPICMWDCGGVATYFKQTLPGGAAIANNEADFRRALKTLTESPGLRYEKGRKALAVAKSLPAEEMAKNYGKLYDGLLGNGSYNVQNPPLKITAVPKVMGLAPPAFTGVTRAVEAWIGGKLASLEEIRQANPDVLIIGGDSGNYTESVKGLRKQGYKGKILFTWHSSFTFHSMVPKDTEILASWFNLLDGGLIDRIGFVKPSQHLPFNDDRVIYFPNRVPPKRSHHGKIRHKDDPLKIGIFGTNHPWKNMHQAILAASLVKDSEIHTLQPCELPRFYYERTKVKVYSHARGSHEGFQKLLGSMDCNLQLSLTESFGLTACESWRLGIPCLVSPSVDLINTVGLRHVYNDTIVYRPDDLAEVAEQIQYLVDRTGKLSDEMNHALDLQMKENDKIIAYEMGELTK